MTVYEYFAYPHSLRPRVSQVLVFPPHQRAGHGTRLLQHFYDECRSRPEVLDIPGAMLMLKSSDVTVNVRVRLVIRFA